MTAAIDSRHHRYVEFGWIRVTDLGDRIRINSVSDCGRVKRGPEVMKGDVGKLIQVIVDLA